jgi:REP element-mobilizing transposase RayT
MARPLRVQAAGAHYHVGARGIDRGPVFLSDEDRERFLVMLGDVVERYGWRCHAYCLMPNHYHLALTTPEPNLGAGMGRLNQVYAQWFNHRHDRVGHLFEQRYWSRLLEAEERFLAVARYIVANPVRAGLADTPNGYPWSSARAMNEVTAPPRFLDLTWVRELAAGSHEHATNSAHPPFGV